MCGILPLRRVAGRRWSLRNGASNGLTGGISTMLEFVRVEPFIAQVGVVHVLKTEVEAGGGDLKEIVPLLGWDVQIIGMG